MTLIGIHQRKQTVNAMTTGPRSDSPPTGGKTPAEAAEPASSQPAEAPARDPRPSGSDADGPGKVIRLMYCEVCRKPVSSKAVRRFQFFHMVLCNVCYNRFYRRGGF